MTDDIVDEPGLENDTRERLIDEWTSLILKSYKGEASGIDWLDALMRDLVTHGLPFSIIQELMDGVQSDLKRNRFESEAELVRYSYQVASTVGIMMCYLFDETDEWVLERAAALGLGMQLTNIYRDVGTDLRLGRVYLPNDWFVQFGADSAELESFQSGDVLPQSYVNMIKHLEHVASQEYAKAWEAIPSLSWRFGPSVAAAATVYKAIHKRIHKNGYDNLTKRAFTTPSQKMVLIAWSSSRFTLYKLLSPFTRRSRTRGNSD